jgi:hypothetical protein
MSTSKECAQYISQREPKDGLISKNQQNHLKIEESQHIF